MGGLRLAAFCRSPLGEAAKPFFRVRLGGRVRRARFPRPFPPDAGVLLIRPPIADFNSVRKVLPFFATENIGRSLFPAVLIFLVFSVSGAVGKI